MMKKIYTKKEIHDIKVIEYLRGRNEGYDAGYIEGNENTQFDTHLKGIDEGYKKGQKVGYFEGYCKAKEDGYAKGCESRFQ